MSLMLQAVRDHRRTEDAQKESQIWVDAEVGGKACQARKEAKAQNGN